MDGVTAQPASVPPGGGHTVTLTAALEHLSGRARGTTTWLGGSALDVSLAPHGQLRIDAATSGPAADGVIARLHALDGTYEVEACGAPIWVNRKPVAHRRLGHGDVIEFGSSGPLCRIRVIDDRARAYKTVGGLMGDCVAYLRGSRKPFLSRCGCAVRDLLTGLTRQTTLLFRVTVIAAIVGLTVFSVLQNRSSVRLQKQVEQGAGRLESFASALTRARQESLRPGDLRDLRQDLAGRLAAADARLAQLEDRSVASARIIAAATRSVVFLQGAYGFRDIESKRMLRHVVDDDGRRLLSPFGQPLLTLEGEGPVAERQFTGTAFVVSGSGVLVTNRHVALPWENDATVTEFSERGLEPVWIKFIGYLPDVERAFPVTLLRASDDADLAILQCEGVTAAVPHLTLSATAPSPGDEVIVMGYPTGLRSMLAQTGDLFLSKLENANDIDFWKVAQRLSDERYIRPLASRGIIGQATPATVAYDAETTHGGSGGPVLDIDGEVIGVNTAIIPEYGGSNLGVPVEHVRKLLAAADLS